MSGIKKAFIKLFSLCLILLMAVQYLGINFAYATQTSEENSQTSYVRIADPSTMSDWKKYKGIESTAYAGAIWTDKSVFTDTTSDDVKDIATSDGTKLSMVNDDENFLISLSAISATKSIEGYSLKPTDTVFVLDVSSSMYSADEASRIKQLVVAANEAIDTLLNLNKNNRVAIVLYSGLAAVDSQTSSSLGWYGRGIAKENTTMVLLPLGRYTPNSNKKYIELVYNASADHDDHMYKLQTVSSLKDETTGNIVSQRSKYVNGGTYIQNGLFTAWNSVFKNADTTVEVGSIFQAGVNRLPVMILMSDGAPTAGTTNYAPSEGSTIGNSNAGNCALAHNTDDLAFLTQLTASWVSGKINGHYSEDLLFYTIGIGIDIIDTSSLNEKEDIDRMERTPYQARQVLNPTYTPSGSNNIENSVATRVNALWETYNSLSGSQKMDVYLTKAQFSRAFYTTQISKISGADNRDYVTQFYDITESSKITETFSSIVHEIELQSEYLPTYAEFDDNLDGYITFIDDLGKYMDVKKVQGIAMGNTLYSGAKDMDNVSSSSAVYKLAVESVIERMEWSSTVSGKEAGGIKLSEAEAKELLNNAISKGQVYYNTETDFGNSIGWYADEKGLYLGFWDWSNSGDTAPENAKYTIQSYFFSEKLADIDTVKENNLMYISVQVRTEISTGDVSLIWRIPASIIPVSEYNVSIKGDINQVVTDEDVTASVTVTEADPIVLLYEVGLKDYITPETIVGVMSNEDPNDYEIDEDGNYVFYSNMYDLSVITDDLKDLTVNVTQTDAINTVSYFQPNEKNERYYFIENSDVYIKNGDKYVKYTGATKPAENDGNTYYYLHYIFDWSETHDKDNAKLVRVYDELWSEEVTSVRSYTNSDGNITGWYVPINTMGEPTFSFDTEKTDNATGTYGYSHMHGIEISSGFYGLDGILEGDKVAFALLGNNGKLKMKPSQGIVLSKAVEGEIDFDDEFVFTLHRTDENASATDTCIAILEDSDYNELKTEVLTFVDNKITYTLKAAQRVYFVGLPTGAEYEITEAPANGYMLKYITVDGNMLVGSDDIPYTSASDITIEENAHTYVEFTNEKVEVGKFSLTKTVTLPSTIAEAEVPADLEFKFEVDLGDNYKNKQVADSTGKVYTADSNGKIEVKFGSKGGTVTFESILVGTEITVTEIVPTDADYYITDGVNSKTTTITQTADDSVVAITFDNTLVDTDGDITIKKTVTVPANYDKQDEVANMKFEFTVDFGKDYKNTKVYDSIGKDYTTDENGKLVVNLKKDESIKFVNIKVDTLVKVTETLPTDGSYKVTDGESTKSATIKADNSASVVFDNTLVDIDGDITIKKTVTVPANYDKQDEVANMKFEFTLDFGKDYKNTKVYDSTGKDYTTDENGKLVVNLKKDESIKFVNIKVDTVVKVTETLPTDGSYKVTDGESTKSATIKADNSASVVFDNTLVDIDGDITVKKTVIVPDGYDKLNTVNTRKFDFTVDFGKAYKNTTVYDSQSNAYDLDDKGIVKISLKKDESITFADIKVGTVVKVTEDVPNGADFKVTVGDETKQATVTNDDKAYVEFSNTLIDIDGDITIKKTVTVPANYDKQDEVANMKFEFTVDFGKDYKNTKVYDSTGKDYTTDENGKLVVNLKKDESIKFVNIKVDTVVKVTETLPTDGSYKVTDGESTKSATIKADNSASVVFDNTLVDIDGDITVKKTVIVPDGYDKLNTVNTRKFDFTVDFGKAYKNTTVYDSQSNAYDLDDKGIVKISLKKDESITFADIKVGTVVKVTEDVPNGADFKVTVGDETKQATVTNDDKAYVEFSNTLIDTDGDITIQKTVTIADDYDKKESVSDMVFDFTVDFGIDYQNSVVYDADGTEHFADENGVVAIQLRQDESITFVDIKVDTKVKVTEIIPDGAEYRVTDGKKTQKATIVAEEPAMIVFDNTFANVPITGDNTRMSLYVCAFAVSLSVAVVVYRKKRNA